MSPESICGRLAVYSKMNKTPYINFQSAVENAAIDSPDQNVYLLIDQAGLPGFSCELQMHSVPRVMLFDDTKEKSAVAATPVLILAAAHGVIIARKRLFNWLSEYASDAFSTVAIVSPLTIGAMRRRLSARLQVELSEKVEAIFRFYDPRILATLINILDTVERDIFLGLASNWIYPNRSGHLESIKTTFYPDDAFKAPLKLRANQEFAFLEASEVDQVLDLLRTVTPRRMAEFSGPEKYSLVKDLICKAKHEGINSILGYSIFSSIFLSGGSKFLDSPLWSEIMNELQNGTRDVARLDNLIDDLFRGVHEDN